MIKDSKAYKYAKWCVDSNNKLAPEYVKKQAKEWIKIANVEYQDVVVSEKSYNKICKLLKLMIHPDLICPM